MEKENEERLRSEQETQEIEKMEKEKQEKERYKKEKLIENERREIQFKLDEKIPLRKKKFSISGSNYLFIPNGEKDFELSKSNEILLKSINFPDNHDDQKIFHNINKSETPQKTDECQKNINILHYQSSQIELNAKVSEPIYDHQIGQDVLIKMVFL